MMQKLIFLPRENSYDFKALTEAFPVIQSLKNVEQDPDYHGEGDVFIHTENVCRALTEFPEWVDLSDEEKGILYLAAFFHDLGKERCTRVEDGKIVSPKHAVMGAKRFRADCYRRYETVYDISFQEREEIAWLIRYHGLPLFFMEKEGIDMQLYRARECVRFSLLYLLAKADIMGRECRDKASLLSTVEYFKEYSVEAGCYDACPAFANEYTRLRFYRGGGVWPGDCLYDDTRFPVYLMAGFPLAGKDTYIMKNFPDLPVVSLDDIREEWGVSPASGSGAVAAEARERAKVFLRKEQPFVWDATNLSVEIRRKLFRLFEDYGARVILLYIEAPYEELLRRNKIRPRSVPEQVINQMIGRFDMIEPSECYRVVYVTDNNN